MFLLALIGTESSDSPIEALPKESVSYAPTHWPIRQTNPERSGGGACSSRCFAAQRDGHCPKREHSRDAGSDGTRLAPRGPRVAKPMRPSSFVRLPSHCGHIHRRKLLFSRSISARYMSVPSWGHRTLGTMSSSVVFSSWLRMKYPR